MAELVVRYIFKFPVYGLEKRVKIRDCGWSNIYKPYSKYKHFENRNQVFQRNNLGLPGTDIIVSENSKYIFVLGSSSIEATQMPSEKMATSVFQKELNKINTDYQVINAAYGGRDIYDLYRRAAYFEKFFEPSYIMLIIVKLNEQWLDSHSFPLDFEFKKGFGEIDKSFFAKIKMDLRGRSSLLNLVYTSFRNLIYNRKRTIATSVSEEKEISERYYSIIREYKKKYKEKLLILSAIVNIKINDMLGIFCKQSNIPFFYSNIRTSENSLDGYDHLNLTGNKLLGEFMFGSFKKIKLN